MSLLSISSAGVDSSNSLTGWCHPLKVPEDDLCVQPRPAVFLPVRWSRRTSRLVLYLSSGSQNEILAPSFPRSGPVIREHLFPAVKLRYAGYTAWRGVVIVLRK